MLPPLPAFILAPAVRHAFTLVEMLVVMAVIVVLIGICAPVVTALKNAGDVTRTVYDLAGLLEQSRAYAMGNNTYVYVGLAEVDVTQSPSVSPQQAGMGRLVAAVVSTKDGTQGFSNGSTANTISWSNAYTKTFAPDLAVVGKPLVVDNMHIPDLGAPPTTGGMVRPVLANDSSMNYSLGNTQCVSATPFDYPIGAGLGRGQYSFTKVIQFDPQGVARMQSASHPSAITPYMEIGLEQTHGTAVPTLPASPTSGDVAAIQIDGMTGAVRVYRP